jgi:hypothetical protein
MVAVEEKISEQILAQNLCFITKSFRFEKDIILFLLKPLKLHKTAVDIDIKHPLVCFKTFSFDFPFIK